MLRFIPKKLKPSGVTLRFSILSIFIILFLLSMLSLILLTHIRFTQSMTTLAFDLMDNASASIFQQIYDEIKDVEVKSNATAELIKSGVINPEDKPKFVAYTVNLLQQEMEIFPIVQSIIWGDEFGNFIMANRQDNGSIYSEIIDRASTPPTRTFIDRDIFGNLIRTSHSTDLSYDPRSRVWYTSAKKSGNATWLDIYPYGLTGFLGTSVSTPAYNAQKQLIGVITFNVRLDYLLHLVENTHFSQHGLIYIIDQDGKLVAFPGISQHKNKTLMSIHDLPNQRYVVAAFQHYKNTGEKKFQLEYDDIKYLVTYIPLYKFGNNNWVIGMIAPADDFIGSARKTHLITVLFNIIILFVGVLLVSNLVTHVVNPLKKITREIKRIKNFELEGNIRVQSRIKEISFIADALYSMKKGLRIFQKYVPRTLVRQLIESGEDVRVGGIKKPLVILFSDITDFTRIAEQVEPDQLTRHICKYFDELTQIISLNHGTIDKYIGDAIMAFWGAPLAVEDPAAHAAKAALRCMRRSTELNRQWQATHKPILFTRFGLHLGDAIVGNLGSRERLNYTAIGDAINVASRLEGINKIYGTQIIVSDTIYQKIKNQFILRIIDRVILKGKDEASNIYELVAEEREQIYYDFENYTSLFAKGFLSYQQGKWNEAVQYFTECTSIYHQDTVAPVFIKRCYEFEIHPPSHWDGTWRLT